MTHNDEASSMEQNANSSDKPETTQSHVPQSQGLQPEPVQMSSDISEPSKAQLKADQQFKTGKDLPHPMSFDASLRLHLLNGMAAMLRLLGFRGIAMLGNGLGRLMWLAMPARRRLATTNIALHLGMPEEKAATLAAESFRQSARSFLEIVHTKNFSLQSPKFHVLQPELWERLRATTRPIVVASGHMGAWELQATVLGETHAAPRPRMMVVRRFPDPAVQNFITSQRESRGATMIGHRTVASSVLRALRLNGVVAFLVDHNALRSEALFLPFLGEEAAVNIGPALLAVRGNAEIWPITLLRDGHDYALYIQEPLDTMTLQGSREEKVRAAAQFYTAAMEKVIRAYPAQWFWMHNRWKTRPL